MIDFFRIQKKIIRKVGVYENIIKKEIDLEESLRKRLEIICDFCNTTPTIINGSIRKVDKTNDEYKNIQTLSITLNNVDNQIQEN